jgi:hypothetical protein
MLQKNPHVDTYIPIEIPLGLRDRIGKAFATVLHIRRNVRTTRRPDI